MDEPNHSQPWWELLLLLRNKIDRKCCKATKCCKISKKKKFCPIKSRTFRNSHMSFTFNNYITHERFAQFWKFYLFVKSVNNWRIRLIFQIFKFFSKDFTFIAQNFIKSKKSFFCWEFAPHGGWRTYAPHWSSGPKVLSWYSMRCPPT